MDIGTRRRAAWWNAVRSRQGKHSRSFPLVALLLFTALSRAPFIDAGFGLDPDAQRVVITARAIRDTGLYRASRLPGYPVQEYFTSWLVQGGVRMVNGGSVFMSCLCAVFFTLCLRASNVRDASLLATGFGAVPAVYINSTCAMDYIWALAFVLAGSFYALRQRALVAGICVGLAIGTRITSGAMLFPLALLVAAKSPSPRHAVRGAAQLMLAALAVGGLAYTPAYLRYGQKFLTYADAAGAGSPEAILRRGTLGVWGTFGCIALAWALVTALAAPRQFRGAVQVSMRRAISAACLSVIALYVVAYLKLPHEAGYLIPIVPFAIWLERIS